MDGYYWKWMKPVKICGFLLCLESCFIPASNLTPVPGWGPHNGQSTSRRAGRPCLTYSIHCVLAEVPWIVDAVDSDFANIWILEFQVLAGKPQLVWENHFCPCEGSPHLQSVSLLLAFSMEGVDLASKMGFKFIDVYQNLTIQCHNESRVSTFPSILLSICPSI